MKSSFSPLSELHKLITDKIKQCTPRRLGRLGHRQIAEAYADVSAEKASAIKLPSNQEK